MPRLPSRSRTSRPRTTSLSGPRRFRTWSSSLSGLVAALALLLAASPAFAKKKDSKADTQPPPAAEPAKPAGPVAPPADSAGRVHFGPEGEGQGRVTVRAAGGEKVQVYLDGRYFGDTPVTIWSVPKGDYIVEGTYPNGKQVSRPVSVSEGEESNVDIAAGKIESAGTAAGGGGFMSGDISPTRLRLAKGLLIGGAALLVVGAVFGILELKKESDYKNAPNDQAMLDDIANSGRRYALLANIGYVTGGLAIIGAGIAALPLFFHSSEKTSSTTAFMIMPGLTPGSGTATFTLRF